MVFLCIRYEIHLIDLAFRVYVALLEQCGPADIPPGQTKRPGRRSHLPPADLPPLLHPLRLRLLRHRRHSLSSRENQGKLQGDHSPCYQPGLFRVTLAGNRSGMRARSENGKSIQIDSNESV